MRDEWIERDPDAVTDWFDERVGSLSPDPSLYAGVAVEVDAVAEIE